MFGERLHGDKPAGEEGRRLSGLCLNHEGFPFVRARGQSRNTSPRASLPIPATRLYTRAANKHCFVTGCEITWLCGLPRHSRNVSALKGRRGCLPRAHTFLPSRSWEAVCFSQPRPLRLRLLSITLHARRGGATVPPLCKEDLRVLGDSCAQDWSRHPSEMCPSAFPGPRPWDGCVKA